jgi:hypothetical protein
MAKIRTIIEKESFESSIIHLYKEGIFLKGYEQSAYLFSKYIQPTYQVKTKYIKAVSQWVCSIGFPENALNAIVSGKEIIPTAQGADILLEETIDKAVYEEWKANRVGVESEKLKTESELQKESESPTTSTTPILLNEVYKQIIAFDLANQTPMQCVLFLSNLQGQLKEQLRCI